MMQKKTQRIAVIGAGAWGTALAFVFSSNGTAVSLWGRDQKMIDAINRDHENTRYLPKVILGNGLEATSDLDVALADADIVMLVTPVATTAEIGAKILERIKPSVPIVCCSKGIDPVSEMTPSQTLMKIDPSVRVAVLSGPSFAADVARGLPTAVVLAAKNLELAVQLSKDLARPKFRIYAHNDLRGVELGGALKNVIALAVGACRGLKLGASAEAAVISRGFDELTRILAAMGGDPQTLTGLSGMGDLVLSCSNEESRNMRYGIAIGRGEDLSKMPLAEGAKTVGVAARITKRLGLECAIIEGIAKLVKREISSEHLIQQLLQRPLKHEQAQES